MMRRRLSAVALVGAMTAMFMTGTTAAMAARAVDRAANDSTAGSLATANVKAAGISVQYPSGWTDFPFRSSSKKARRSFKQLLKQYPKFKEFIGGSFPEGHAQHQKV